MKKTCKGTGWGAERAADARRLSLICAAIFVLASSAAGRDMSKLNPKETMDQLVWWNNDSIMRMWGCDKCQMGDIACSMGSSIAARKGVPCGYILKPADYYGYMDTDEIKFHLNPLYRWYDDVYDLKLDFESGIPDEAVVNESIRSIKSNVTAFFVEESEWKGPPFWMHIMDQNPWGERVDWQRWLMPCADNSQDVEYKCKWWLCRRQSDDPCPCFNDPPGSCSNKSCDIMGVSQQCREYGGDCYQQAWEDRPISECENLPPGTPYNDGNYGIPGSYDGWYCYPVKKGTEEQITGDEGASYCGWGGVFVLIQVNKSEIFNYTGYPLNKTANGDDLNDDLPIRNPPSMTPTYPGKMPFYLTEPIFDDDLVRDRYWKRNATDTQFKGTRFGYCANEREGDMNAPSSCTDDIGDLRDDYDRPASKQHDPCKECEDGFDNIYEVYNPGHNVQNPVCPNECYTYDLRYYRQFSIDSVWANIFKIAPELDYMYTTPPPGTGFPDAIKVLPDRRGKYKCSRKEIGDSCGSTDECIPGMECRGSLLTPDQNTHCCPSGTYWAENCCRWEETHVCTELQPECPGKYRVPADNNWGEFDPQEYKGWVIENFHGIKRDDNKYLLGLGEKGCVQAAECSDFRNSKNLNERVGQHCSDINRI
jgi:hypothetical protein